MSCRGEDRATERHVFLLRGIGPSTHRVMTMTALEQACRVAGLPETRNLLATGNLIVRSGLDTPEIEARFQAALDAGGLRVTWQRRTGDAFCSALAAARGLDAAAAALRDRPSSVQLHFTGGPVADAALAVLRDHAPDAGVARAGSEVLIDYGAGISTSPLTLARVDKALGRAQTARNWNTLCRIEALL
jgi:uncharacterized protein (DUF1697 family)